jgi:gliding motility-associated-like protein
LIVEICYHDSIGAQSANDYVAHSATTFPSTYQRYGNNLLGTGCAISNSQGIVNTDAFQRPRIRFYVCEPPAGTKNYLWTPANDVSSQTIQNPIALLNNNAVLHVTTIDQFSCAHRDSTVYIVSIRYPNIKPTDTTICETEKVLLQASGGQFYNWVAANPASLSCLNCPSPIASVNVTSNFIVIISDQYNCADTLSATIHVHPLPVVDIKPEDTTVKYDAKVELQVTGAQLYFWYPTNALSNPNVDNPFAIIHDTLTIFVTGMDEYGCRNKDSVHFDVDMNDVFRIGSVLFEKLQEFRVFNRWGQEVFSTTDIMQGWDGTYKGEKMPTGVYNYIIRIGYPNGISYTYKGNVTLVR